MVKRVSILLFCLSNFFYSVHAGIIGSLLGVSVEPLVTFTPIVPIVNPSNYAQAFGWLKGGFTLQDLSTTCTFNSVFPVEGPVSLNGGQLWLTNNLVLNNPATITTNGFIYGNNYTFDLAPTVTWLSRTIPLTLDNINVFLNGDLSITGTVNIRGKCSFNARNNRISFAPGSVLKFYSGSQVTFKNVELYGVRQGNFSPVDDSVSIVLDNMRLVQATDLYFNKGSILFSNEVNFVGAKTFRYTSSLTSTIDTDSVWYLSDIATLQIGRKNGINSREPLFFQDSSSTLRMENSSLNVTSSGMCLTRGRFLGDGQVNLDMDSTAASGGLRIGKGTSTDNFYFSLYPEAVMNLNKGHYIYDIVGNKSGFINDQISINFIKKNAGSHFISNQNLSFKNVTIKADPASSTNVVPGKKIYFDNSRVQSTVAEFTVTATRTNEFVYHLAGDGQIYLHSGRYPLITQVSGKGNKLSGVGAVSGAISLLDNTTELTLDFRGKFDTNITMAPGSKLILTGDLIFDREAKIVGSGIISAGGYDLFIDMNGTDWTSTVTFQATDSVLNLVSDLNLKSCLTFQGDWVIDANGKTINLDTLGNIIVGSNSSLYIKNANITNAFAKKIKCLDNSGVVIFDQTSIYLGGDYTYDVGTFCIYNNFDIFGNAKFTYASSLTSTIHKRASFNVQKGTTLEVGRRFGWSSAEPLYFEDDSSTLSLDNCTFSVTPSGVGLTRGRVLLTRSVETNLQSTQFNGGMTVGDGTETGDLEIEWSPGASLHLSKGRVMYNGYDPNLFIAKAKNSSLSVGDTFKLYMKRSMHVKNLVIYTSPGFEVVVEPDKTTTYEDYRIVYGDTQYEVTGRFYDNYTMWLNGLSSIALLTGSMPSATYITGSSNIIYGAGNILGPVILGDSSSQLIISMLGTFYNDITMNQSTILLDKRLTLGPKKQIKGSGIIQQLSEIVFVDGRDTTWTGTITWNGGGGIIQLMSDMKLSSLWSFEDDCMIDGNGFSIDLRDTGQFSLAPNASLHLKNISIKGLSGNRINCADNTGLLVLDNVGLVQSDDFYFDIGKINFIGSSSISGKGKSFVYRSSGLSQVMPLSDLTLHNGLIFSYDPPIASRRLFELADQTSKLILRSSTIHSTPTGLQLLKGEMEVRGQCVFISDAMYKAEGIIFGDAITPANDLNITIYPSASLHVGAGWVVDNNVS